MIILNIISLVAGCIAIDQRYRLVTRSGNVVTFIRNYLVTYGKDYIQGIVAQKGDEYVSIHTVKNCLLDQWN